MKRVSLFVDREESLGAGLNLGDQNSSLAPYFLNTGNVVLALILAGVFAFLNFVPLGHTDVWGHLRFGEQILDTHAFLAGDTFCPFAEPKSTTINYCWLSQALIAAVFRVGEWTGGSDPLVRLAGGADALRFLHASAVAARFLLLFFAFRRAARSGALAAMGLVFIALVGFGSLGVLRPQVFAEVLFAAMLIPLSSGETTGRAVIGIPIVMVLWANSHGSYPIGLMMLGVVWAARLLEVLTGPPPRISSAWSDWQLQRMTLVILVSLAGIAILNPEGYRIFLVTMEMANQPNVQLMDEWQPLWSPNTQVARIAFGVCMGLILISFVAARGRFRWTTWLALAVFGGQAVLHQRGLIWLFTVAPWLAMPYLGDAFARYRPASWVSVPSFRKTLIVGMIAVIAVLWSLPVQRLTGGQKPDLSRSLSDGTPWEPAASVAEPDAVTESPLTKAIRSTFPGGRFAGTIYAGDTLGDFFLWRLPAPVPVYMYSHVHLFSAEQWQRYTAIRDVRPGWRSELDAAKINLVVVRPALEPGIYQQLRTDPAWSVVTDEATLTTKRDPRHRLFVALRKEPLIPAGRAATP
jgi:hypothetical protein